MFSVIARTAFPHSGGRVHDDVGAGARMWEELDSLMTEPTPAREGTASSLWLIICGGIVAKLLRRRTNGDPQKLERNRLPDLCAVLLVHPTFDGRGRRKKSEIDPQV